MVGAYTFSATTAAPGAGARTRTRRASEGGGSSDRDSNGANGNKGSNSTNINLNSGNTAATAAEHTAFRLTAMSRVPIAMPEWYTGPWLVQKNAFGKMDYVVFPMSLAREGDELVIVYGRQVRLLIMFVLIAENVPLNQPYTNTNTNTNNNNNKHIKHIKHIKHRTRTPGRPGCPWRRCWPR